MPLVVHCWADLQSGHGLRCYGNTMRTRNVSEYMLVLALCLVTTVMMNSSMLYLTMIIYRTKMWGDAHRDGRPAEYGWRPLFNAAKFA